MTKIDNSTFKAIKKDKKDKEYISKVSTFDKGHYGHSRKYKNTKMMMVLVLFLFILADVMISLILFQTRKTWFIVFGCIMAIPFARNLIDFIMALKAEPLEGEEYETVSGIEEETGKCFLYDISITDTDGVVYIPCMMVCNNNIVAFVPKVKEASGREKIKKYIGNANTLESFSGTMNFRIVVTENIKTFEKEVRKIKLPDKENKKYDNEMRDRILSMGF
ncbi:MAG: hypothetical protein IKS48_12445 [Eubacterium sp.]|nr:hypothetical protein [Eubacterium sp.]